MNLAPKWARACAVIGLKMSALQIRALLSETTDDRQAIINKLVELEREMLALPRD